MTERPFDVDPDLAKARTPPAALYRDPEAFRQQVDRVLARSWHWIGDEGLAPSPGSWAPVDLLPETLSEPVLVLRDERGRVGARSNVCTHRGNLLASAPGRGSAVRCGYHGRCFGLDGRVLAAPGFEDAPGFPSEDDALPAVPFGSWRGHLFASIAPARPFDDWIRPARDLLAWAPIESMHLDPASVVDHEVEAHWALYVENYLEGFHVPFVHAGLARSLDVGAYETRALDGGVLQVGYAAEGEAAFAAPVAPPSDGRRVAAWWLWLFPTTMLNVYPWGVSVNAVAPRGPCRTRVRFASYVLDEGRRREGAGGDLGRVEEEDERVVSTVQRGLRSRLTRRGRYSPRHEVGVHRFHLWLAEALSARSPPAR